MKMKSLWAVGVVAAATFCAALPAYAADASCSAPGVVVGTDPAGDETGAPATSFADLLSVSLAEPGNNLLVFTVKLSDLATILPNQAWIVRYQSDSPPANGDSEFFVAMVTGPDATPHFIYGTAGSDPAGETLLFNPAGDLDASSTFNADGTLTLALDKSKASLVKGAIVTAMVPLTHRITPTDGTLPFWYGLRSEGSNEIAYDEIDNLDDYFIGQGNCGGGKSGVLGLGAMPLPALTILFGIGALRRRRAIR